MTKNAIHTVAESSNSILSLPLSSSSTFDVAPYKQSDIYGIEESESFHNSKGDIAD